MRVATYLRVSTRGQDVEPQRLPLGRLITARGWDLAAEYVDVASGRRDRRPGLDALVAAARRGEIEAVAVVKLDRLARSVRHLVDLVAEFEALNVHLVVLDQGLDTSTPAGRLLFHVISAIAEFERDLIVERTRAGLAAARRRGARLGRPRALDRRARQRAVRLRRAGRSLRQIARLLGCGRSTVARTLARAA